VKGSDRSFCDGSSSRKASLLSGNKRLPKSVKEVVLMASVGPVAPREWNAVDLGAFFVRNRSEFLAHAKRVTRTSAEAEEVVQDSLVRVLLACPELESADHALSYFHRVIENLSIDLHRREGRQPRLVVLDDATSEVEAKWSVDPDYSEQIAAADDAAIVREAISLLSPAERAALVMWEFEGRSTAEIARKLGIKESTVRHTLSRARAGLRRILSERIIDEERGLTALDFLSVAYRKAETAVQKSSKVAFSLALVFTAFLGFNSLAPTDFVANEPVATAERSIEENGSASALSNSRGGSIDEESIESDTDEVSQEIAGLTAKAITRSFSVSAVDLAFAGLDGQGLPTGFTVADSLGSLGVLFSGQQNSIITETGLLLSNIVSTKSGATNVLINQSVVFDAFGTSYIAQVSVGIDGGWRPLRLSYVTSDIERVASGNYLLNAVMMVDSAMETYVKVPTSTSGTDLSSAPKFISTRVTLDPTKTKILAQAVLVSADSQGDGA
jgi:RNA polymerase sigma factor (sigma-70 family)